MVQQKLIAAAALALAVLPASAHAATTYNTFNGVTGGYGNTDPATGTFTDTFTFTLATAGKLNATLQSSMTTATSYLENIDFTAAGVTISSLTTSAIPFTQVLTGQFEILTFSHALSAGTYTLSVTGNAAQNGIYFGSVNFAAVPESSSWALMILGLGAVGYGMRRRNASQKVAVSFG